MNKIVFLFLVTLSSMSFAGTKGLYPFREELFKIQKANKFLDGQVSSVRSKFYKIFSINIIPSNDSKTRDQIYQMLTKLDNRVEYQQRFLSKCSFSYTKSCRNLFKQYIKLLNDEIAYGESRIKKIQIRYIRNTLRNYHKSLIDQFLYFNTKYASLNIQEKRIVGDHLYSTHKFLRDSINESFEYFVKLANHKSASHFVGFFHRFIIPTHHITASYANHLNIVRNFEDLSRTLYDFSFYMDKFQKISKKTKITANIMMSHWNYIHKYFTKR